MKIALTTLFGIESVLVTELMALGYDKKNITTQTGLVTIEVDSEAELRRSVAHLNFWLRTAERVYVCLNEAYTATFDDVFEFVLQQPWERWLNRDACLVVNGSSVKSQLFGVPSLQRIIKKAIVNSLQVAYNFAPHQVLPEKEQNGTMEISFRLFEDKMMLMLDTSGQGLHKRGYRPLRHEAPLRETVAAAILMLSHYERNLAHDEVLYDAFCGSGTFAIEAALIASNTAPGLRRHFSGEKLKLIGKPAFDRERELAKLASKLTAPPEKVRIFGADASNEAVELAKSNAVSAGVEAWVNFQVKRIEQTTLSDIIARAGTNRILLVGNPPYGERMLDPREAEDILCDIADLSIHRNDDGNLPQGLRLSILSPHPEFEYIFGSRADKRRKLYNGKIACTLFHYHRWQKCD